MEREVLKGGIYDGWKVWYFTTSTGLFRPAVNKIMVAKMISGEGLAQEEEETQSRFIIYILFLICARDIQTYSRLWETLNQVSYAVIDKIHLLYLHVCFCVPVQKNRLCHILGMQLYYH